MRIPFIALAVALLTGGADAPPVSKSDLTKSIAAAEEVSSGESCRSQIGEAKAADVANYCRWVSSATHPPCNVENSCSMMIEHIRYMCRATEGPTLAACERLYGKRERP